MRHHFNYIVLMAVAIMTGVGLVGLLSEVPTMSKIIIPRAEYTEADQSADNQKPVVKQNSFEDQVGQVATFVPVIQKVLTIATTTTVVAPRDDSAVTLAFVGDIMLDRGVKQSVNLRAGGDYNFSFKDLTRINGADILFGNLEGPVSARGQDVGSQYSFRMSPKVLPVLAGQGFDVLSVANNHAGDWGREAFADTIALLKQNNLLPVGGGDSLTDAQEPRIIEKGGMKFGFLGFSDVGLNWLVATGTTPGILLANNPNFSQIIKNAAGQVDFLIASFHFGEEYEPMSNARQQDLAKNAILAGAKIVVGHHPHVPQEVVKYRGGLIAYSLGNFVFDQYFSHETMNGLALKVKVKNGQIVDYQVFESHLNKQFQVVVE